MTTQRTAAFNLSDPFLAVLVSQGLLAEQQASAIAMQVRQAKLPVIRALIEQYRLDSKTLALQLASYLQLEFFDLNQLHPEIIFPDIVAAAFVRQHRILPLFIQQQRLYLAISEPSQLEQLAEIKFYTDLELQPVVVELDKLNRLLYSWLSDAQHRPMAGFSASIATLDSDQQVVRVVEQLLHDAIVKGASDIHIEPSKSAYRIRFRLDGILHKITQLPVDLGNRINARLKILARLDMAERRLPQDGRFSSENPALEPKDCRISVCPTLFGEKIVVRILDSSKVTLNIDELGLEAAQKELFLAALQKPQGMVLVTGPTGSGKTVSLYSALYRLNSLEKNICSVEEPVEISLPGINQIHVDPKIELSFAKVLRAFLRQDPDILMVGEIRDQETADTAIKAAQTGHLVLTTLHTNSAAESFMRLRMLGVSWFNMAQSIHLVMAQRLVRRLCQYCKQQKTAGIELAINVRGYMAMGCDSCSQGYKGRTGVFECLSVSPQLATLIAQGKSTLEIIAAAQKAGMVNLKQATFNKVIAGITSLEEMNRVIVC